MQVNQTNFVFYSETRIIASTLLDAIELEIFTVQYFDFACFKYDDYAHDISLLFLLLYLGCRFCIPAPLSPLKGV